ncbi:MAG: sulfur carrier protein ThiS [Pseudomonadota bacterium]
MTARQLRVQVNGQAHSVAEGATLAGLLEQLGQAPGHTATAVNSQFVARTERHTHSLREGDQITCFQAITGG